MEDEVILRRLSEIETRQSDRDKKIVNKIEELTSEVRSATKTADLAHAIALEAKRHAGKASIDAEGGDQSILAELGSLKVVLNEHADKLQSHDEIKKEERKIDARARRFWRVAQPAIIAIALALLNRLTFLFAPPGAAEPPIKIDPPKISVSDAGVPNASTQR